MKRTLIAFVAFLMLLLLETGCASYTLRYKYPSPVPSQPSYELNGVQVNIIRDAKEFQTLVKKVFGKEDAECMAFTTYDSAGKTIIYIFTNENGGIDLDFLGHEIWYHHMEKEKGH